MTEPKLRCWPGCTAKVDWPTNPNHGMHFLVIERAPPVVDVMAGGPCWMVQPFGVAFATKNPLLWTGWEPCTHVAAITDRLLVPVDPLADPEPVTTDQRIPEVA